METVRAVVPQVQLFDDAVVAEFKASLRGELLQPHDAGYDEARTVWNAMIDRHPARNRNVLNLAYHSLQGVVLFVSGPSCLPQLA
jgi:hypothetical protein